MRRPNDLLRPASVPIPKFARIGGTFRCELQNRRTPGMLWFPAGFNPTVRNRTRRNGGANSGFAAAAVFVGGWRCV